MRRNERSGWTGTRSFYEVNRPKRTNTGRPRRLVRLHRYWFLLVLFGPCVGRISPHNPKVAGSNPAPATSQIVEIKGADSIGLFDRQRRTMRLFDLHRLNDH